ncbi:hypothetical protein Poli38472_002870 [Pythium oligandrum]|uniref:Uncharacterized protein n=1 Tax=Pythium oligandrum TaxID=41045 RepID=A0A8K1C5X5_PYTOL|nr:hypothetical protein Poli38472_002870 [Pythium oligandrum]|eukprot:TMW56945.1 hypothetical protein Poli38472_002870 [Pythium oligandrum]
MVTTTDEERELHAWKEETRRYLLKTVDSSIDEALHELERIDFLWGRIRLSKLAVGPGVKADIRVEGHLVVSANLELKLGKPSRSTAISCALQQYCVLNQILEFHSIMQAQLSRLQLLKAFLQGEHDDLLGDDPQCDVDFFLDVARKIFQDLTKIIHDLRNAANVLRLPSRRRFPYSAYVDHSFKPSLPPEVVIEFSIHRGELLMEIFGLGLTQRAVVNIPDGCCTKKELVGCVCMCRAQKVEIVDYISVSVAIPQVEEMLVHVDTQVATLVHIRDNIKALMDCFAR